MTTTATLPHLVSSTTAPELWLHPTLDLFTLPARQYQPQKARLFTQPSSFGESFDEDDKPQPTSASELPDIHRWTMSFAINALEIFVGRRQPAQLAPRCHHVIYRYLLTQTSSQREVGRIMSIHQDQPLDGICESTVVIAYRERVRALAIRTEGIDGRWLCTALRMI